ncbi:MAG: hypothetical protein HQL18_00905 [Candidatus Omnitrophica bacterium]|nr:hypothetical protein [Candidatus Omnitrophota bacterium]
MKRFFYVMGVLSTILIVIGVIGFLALKISGSQLDAQSKAYVDRIVPQIMAKWDTKAFLAQCAPELQQISPKEQVDGMFKTLPEKLGAWKRYVGSKGEASINLTPQGKFVTAEYVAEADFEKANALFLLRLTLTGNQWKLTDFRVDSPVLAQ